MPAVNFRHLMSRRKNPDRAVSERWILLKGDQPIMSREKKTSFKLGSGRFVHKMPYKISSKMEPGNYTLRLRFELTGKYRDREVKRMAMRTASFEISR